MLTLKLEFEKLRNELYLFLYIIKTILGVCIYIGAEIGGGWQGPGPCKKFFFSVPFKFIFSIFIRHRTNYNHNILVFLILCFDSAYRVCFSSTRKIKDMNRVP